MPKPLLLPLCLIVILLVVVSATGCQKPASGLTGKLVDARERPIADIAVIARPVPTLKYYGQVETVTGPDGRFALSGLKPSSDYELVLRSDRIGMIQKQVRSPSTGRMAALDPIRVRFLTLAEGVISDTKTGLEWAPSPDRTMTWHEAASYAGNLKLGGHGGWRLPTRRELSGIGELPLSFPLYSCCVWTGELKDRRQGRVYNLYRSFEMSAHLTNNAYAVLPVRSPE